MEETGDKKHSEKRKCEYAKEYRCRGCDDDFEKCDKYQIGEHKSLLDCIS